MSIIYLTLYNMEFNTSKLWNYKVCFQLLLIFSASLCIKMALIPAYYSTDHDVHQNWLRITGTKPLSEWYFDEESKWTLDYPPLFAYFQLILSSLSTLISPHISSSINQLPITIYFQRISVIMSEIPFLLVLFWIFREINLKMIISYFSIPFILLDNLHFQYNIIMQALFLLSIQLIRRKEFAKGALAYGTLLNFKHIYLYSSLAFFVFILKEHILNQKDLKDKVKKLIQIGIVTLIPFCISFVPFIIVGGLEQISQIISRLFPFQRGLIHDYWAPNVWSLYYFIDKLLFVLKTKFGSQQIVAIKDMGELHNLRVLPNIQPYQTTILIILMSLPLLIFFFKKKSIRFQWMVFLCGSLFFLFGYHVHQKAITPYIGLLMVFLSNEQQKQTFLDTAVFVNIVNLLPLLIDPNQKLLRIVLPLLWVTLWETRRQIKHILEVTIVTVGFGVIFFHQILHPYLFKGRMQFLPLMINSIFSAAFNVCWILTLYIGRIREKDISGYLQVPSAE